MACANVFQAQKTTLERSFFMLTDTFRIPKTHLGSSPKWYRHPFFFVVPTGRSPPLLAAV